MARAKKSRRFAVAERVLDRNRLPCEGDDEGTWLSGTNEGEEPITVFDRYLVVEEDPTTSNGITILHTTDDLDRVREIIYDAVMGEYYWAPRAFDLDNDGAEVGWDITISLRTP